MKLRSGKTYSSVNPRGELLQKLIELIDECDLETQIIPQLFAHKALFDFLNTNLEQIDPPKNIINLVQRNARSLVPIITKTMRTKISSAELEMINGLIRSISDFIDATTDTAEDEYIDNYVDQSEMWR
jgi:hypothetical protein